MEQLWLYCYQVEQSPQLCDIVGCRGTLAPCKQSLLPAFQGEIPRYRITVRLDAEALTLTDRQQVPYTNNESSKSVGLRIASPKGFALYSPMASASGFLPPLPQTAPISSR